MIVLIVGYNYFIFEIAIIRLGGQANLKGRNFDFILILCFILFILEHEEFFFRQLFSRFG